MLQWLQKLFYNRRIRKELDTKDISQIKLDHELINEANRKRVHEINLKGYQATFPGIENYQFLYDDIVILSGARYYTYNTKVLAKEGDQVLFLLEPSNPHSDHAVKVVTLNGHTIGYVPDDFSESIFNELVKRFYYEVHVDWIDNSNWDYPEIHVSAKVYGPKKSPN